MTGRSRHHARGFTLIEAIASLVVLAVLGSVASSILITATDGYLGSSTHGKMHLEMSIAMDRMVRELRRLPLDTTAPERSPNIDVITGTSIAWRNVADENCEIALNGDALELTVDGGTPAVLLRDVDALTVVALDDAESPVTLPASAAACDVIRQIELTITASRNGEAEFLRTRVFLRATMSTTP